MNFKDMVASVRAEEDARVAEVKALGAVPEACGDAIPEAPARGPVRMFEARALFPDGAEGWKVEPAGYRGRKTLQCADAFDVMEARARKRLFSPGQKAVGRHYRTVFERHASAGVKCISLEAVSGGGGGGGSFIDAVLRDREEIASLRARIGAGVNAELRKLRPSKRGSRATILDRRLVDMVCLEDASMSDVLKAHGWVVKGDTVAALRLALCSALDRMVGPVGGRGVRAAQFGASGPSIWDRGE